jgi:hypothetical protein
MLQSAMLPCGSSNATRRSSQDPFQAAHKSLSAPTLSRHLKFKLSSASSTFPDSSRRGPGKLNSSISNTYKKPGEGLPSFFGAPSSHCHTTPAEFYGQVPPVSTRELAPTRSGSPFPISFISNTCKKRGVRGRSTIQATNGSPHLGMGAARC